MLVVDDDESFRTYVRAALERDGAQVLEAESGPDGVEVALRERPDVILLDWRMPGQSGIATCRSLRERAELSAVRIAMVTGLDDERDRTLARHAGADAFIVKHGDPDALAAQVRRLATSRDPQAAE